MNCEDMNTFRDEASSLISIMGTRGKKIGTLIGMLKSVSDTDPEYFSSLSKIEGLAGAEKSASRMLDFLTGGQIKTVDEYRILKEEGRKKGKSLTDSADLLIDFSADRLVEDMNTYGKKAAKWFDITMDKAMSGWISGVRAGSKAERLNNSVASMMNLQNDLSVLLKQCPVVDSVRRRFHAMQDTIIGRTTDFNNRYTEYVSWISSNYGKDGVYIVNKYMQYMDDSMAEYNPNGTGGKFDILMSALSSDTNIKDSGEAAKILISARDNFWSEFNYGSKEYPAENHFSQMISIDNAKGSFALYQKEVGTYLADILTDGLKTYGFAVSDLSDVHWTILSRFGKEAEIKPFLEAYNKERVEAGKPELKFDPFQLRKGYIPTKAEDSELLGIFKDYGNIHQWKRGHLAAGDFLTALADQIQGLNFSPIAMAEELNIKMIDNVVNNQNVEINKDYNLWRSQRVGTAEKLEKHVEKVYSIVAYHKDSITDKAKEKVAEYRKIAMTLSNAILPHVEGMPAEDKAVVEKNWAFALRGLTDMFEPKNTKNMSEQDILDYREERVASAAKDVVKTVRNANRYIGILERQLDHVKPFVSQDKMDHFDAAKQEVEQLRNIEKAAADFDFNSINISVKRMQNLVDQFDKITDIEARNDFVSRGRSMLAYLKTIQNEINDAPSVFHREAVYKRAGKTIDSAMNNLHYLDKKYGGMLDRADNGLKKYIRRSGFILQNMQRVTRRTKDSSEYISHSNWYDPTTWIGTKSTAMYISMVMTSMLKNSAMSNLIGAVSSAMSLSPGMKQLKIAGKFMSHRGSDAEMNKAITSSVDRASMTVSGAAKELEIFDPTASLTPNQSRMSWEYIKGVPSMALQRYVSNNMQSGPMAGVRTLFNVFGKDPKWMKMEGISGLLTMAGSEGSLMIRGFSKALIDDAVRGKIAILEASGHEIKPADVERITDEVLRDQGDVIRRYMDVTRGRFTKDNKSPWGWGAADMARTRPDVFKGMLLSTMLAFKQPMAFAGNAFAKSVFRLMFAGKAAIGSRSFEPLQGAAIAGPVMAAAWMIAKQWLTDDEKDDNIIEKFAKAPFFSSSAQGLMPTAALESDLSIMKTAVGMLTGSVTSYKDYDNATQMISRLPGPVWDGLWKQFIDDVMFGEVTDGTGWFVDMSPRQYADFVKKRVGLLNVDQESSNAAEALLMHIGNMGYTVTKEAGELIDAPLLMARSLYGDHDYKHYSQRADERKSAVKTMIPFVGPLFGGTNDHVSGMVRMLNYFDLLVSHPDNTWAAGQWEKRFVKDGMQLVLSPFGFNGYMPMAEDYSRSSFQIQAVGKAIMENNRYDNMQKVEYSNHFQNTIDYLYDRHQNEEAFDGLEDVINNNE